MNKTRWSCYRVKLEQRENCQEFQLTGVLEFRVGVLKINDDLISPYHIRSRRTNWLPLGCTPQNIPIKEASYTTFIVELWELFMLFYRLQSPLKSIKILFSLGKSNSGCSCSDIRAIIAWGASSRVKGGSIPACMGTSTLLLFGQKWKLKKMSKSIKTH